MVDELQISESRPDAKPAAASSGRTRSRVRAPSILNSLIVYSLSGPNESSRSGSDKRNGDGFTVCVDSILHRAAVSDALYMPPSGLFLISTLVESFHDAGGRMRFDALIRLVTRHTGLRCSKPCRKLCLFDATPQKCLLLLQRTISTQHLLT